MQAQTGNQQRGQQGRPTASAASGEAKIRQLFDDREEEILAMFSRDPDPKASYTRAKGLAISTYKNAQATTRDPIREASVVQAALYAFQRKLDPGTDVYFVPYKGDVQPITSPQGLINAAYRSGVVGAIDARVVYKKEVEAGNFDHSLGSERFVRHKKGTNARPKGATETWNEIAFAYVLIDIKGADRPVVEVLDKADLEYYKSLSPSAHKDTGLWGKFPAEACRKAVLKQGLARVPKQSEVSEILAYESNAEAETAAAIERIAGAADFTAAGNGEAQPPSRGSDRGAAAPPGRNLDPHAGDPRSVPLPGKNKGMIADAEDKELTYWEGRMRGDWADGKWEGERFADKNFTQLATIRAEMRRRRMDVVPVDGLDGTGATTSSREPDASMGELTPEQEAEMVGNTSDNSGYAS